MIDPDLVAKAILSAPSDAIVAADRDGIIRLWNPGATRIFGFTESQALGQSLDLIIPERLRQRHWNGYRRTMETGESRYGAGELLSVPATRRDGATVSIEFTIVMLRDGAGRMTGIVAVMRDASARFEEMRSLRRKLTESARPAD
ncbi:MAG TPA: PAS domain-containing protein [Xanthobacteraceae bacterium]|jgi:PAS domain S-box-containing protein